MNSAKEISDYFLFRAGQDEDLISNLKLQKLLYYAQGYYLALTKGTPLFPEDLEAWTHGPVVPEIYQEFKKFGAGPISSPEEFDSSIFTPKVLDFLKEIYSTFGQYSAWALRNFTHNEPPWNSVNIGEVISKEQLEGYFHSQLKKQ